MTYDVGDLRVLWETYFILFRRFVVELTDRNTPL